VAEREDRIPVWALWALIALGAIELIAWLASGGVTLGRTALVAGLVAWINLLLLAALVTRRLQGMRRRISQHETAHRATRDEVSSLQLQNEMLQIIARAPDVAVAFQSLAPRITRLVPSDRLGLALLSEDGREFQTFTARTADEDRRAPPRPEVVFKVDGTALGQVVRSREPLLINDTRESSEGYLDVTVLSGSGFYSALVIPLVSKGRAVGTLNFVSRRPGAFTLGQIETVQSIVETLAVAWVVQQLQLSLGRFRTMEVMTEATLSIAAEINSALQTVIGHCDLIRREYADDRLGRDLDTVVRQSHRIVELLDGMRAAARERLQDVAATVKRDGGAGTVTGKR
jgi:transcriptional regulator with GAF, ATPase, and Fis domain